MKNLLASILTFLSLSAQAVTFADFAGVSNTTWTIPTGTTRLAMYMMGGGGAGAAGCNSLGGGGGGRGAGGYIIINSANLSGMQLTITTGVGGYAPTLSPCLLGNIGTSSSVAFPNGWTWYAGGGQRGIGNRAGQGGNMAITGSVPDGFAYGQFNMTSEIGQNAVNTLGGNGGGNGDSGGGGQGGNAGVNGTGGVGGYIHLEAYP